MDYDRKLRGGSCIKLAYTHHCQIRRTVEQKAVRMD